MYCFLSPSNIGTATCQLGSSVFMYTDEFDCEKDQIIENIECAHGTDINIYSMYYILYVCLERKKCLYSP